MKGIELTEYIVVNYTKNDKDALVHFLTEVDLNAKDYKQIISPNAKIIYTSKFNAWYLRYVLKVTGIPIHGVDVGKKYTVNDSGRQFSFSFFDSKSATGSVSLLLIGEFGIYLYTGNFCYYNGLTSAICPEMKLVISNQSLNRLYFDATYYEQKSDYMGYDETVEKISKIMSQAVLKTVYIIVDKIGLESLLIDISLNFKRKVPNELIHVGHKRFLMMTVLGYGHLFTTNEKMSRIYVRSSNFLKKKHDDETCYDLILINRKPELCHNFQSYAQVNGWHIFRFYSHSSHEGCCSLINLFKPEMVIPSIATVDNNLIKFTKFSELLFKSDRKRLLEVETEIKDRKLSITQHNKKKSSLKVLPQGQGPDVTVSINPSLDKRTGIQDGSGIRVGSSKHSTNSHSETNTFIPLIPGKHDHHVPIHGISAKVSSTRNNQLGRITGKNSTLNTLNLNNKLTNSSESNVNFSLLDKQVAVNFNGFLQLRKIDELQDDIYNALPFRKIDEQNLTDHIVKSTSTHKSGLDSSKGFVDEKSTDVKLSFKIKKSVLKKLLVLNTKYYKTSFKYKSQNRMLAFNPAAKLKLLLNSEIIRRLFNLSLKYGIVHIRYEKRNNFAKKQFPSVTKNEMKNPVIKQFCAETCKKLENGIADEHQEGAKERLPLLKQSDISSVEIETSPTKNQNSALQIEKKNTVKNISLPINRKNIQAVKDSVINSPEIESQYFDTLSSALGQYHYLQVTSFRSERLHSDKMDFEPHVQNPYNEVQNEDNLDISSNNFGFISTTQSTMESNSQLIVNNVLQPGQVPESKSLDSSMHCLLEKSITNIIPPSDEKPMSESNNSSVHCLPEKNGSDLPLAENPINNIVDLSMQYVSKTGVINVVQPDEIPMGKTENSSKPYTAKTCVSNIIKPPEIMLDGTAITLQCTSEKYVNAMDDKLLGENIHLSKKYVSETNINNVSLEENLQCESTDSSMQCPPSEANDVNNVNVPDEELLSATTNSSMNRISVTNVNNVPVEKLPSESTDLSGQNFLETSVNNVLQQAEKLQCEGANPSMLCPSGTIVDSVLHPVEKLRYEAPDSSGLYTSQTNVDKINVSGEELLNESANVGVQDGNDTGSETNISSVLQTAEKRLSETADSTQDMSGCVNNIHVEKCLSETADLSMQCVPEASVSNILRPVGKQFMSEIGTHPVHSEEKLLSKTIDSSTLPCIQSIVTNNLETESVPLRKNINTSAEKLSLTNINDVVLSKEKPVDKTGKLLFQNMCELRFKSVLKSKENILLENSYLSIENTSEISDNKVVKEPNKMPVNQILNSSAEVSTKTQKIICTRDSTINTSNSSKFKEVRVSLNRNLERASGYYYSTFEQCFLPKLRNEPFIGFVSALIERDLQRNRKFKKFLLRLSQLKKYMYKINSD